MAEGTRDIERHCKLDYEAFVVKMERKRKWSSMKADQFWHRLAANPNTPRDEKGPEHSKLRLRIPSSLLAKGEIWDEKDAFEERQ